MGEKSSKIGTFLNILYRLYITTDRFLPKLGHVVKLFLFPTFSWVKLGTVGKYATSLDPGVVNGYLAGIIPAILLALGGCMGANTRVIMH